CGAGPPPSRGPHRVESLQAPSHGSSEESPSTPVSEAKRFRVLQGQLIEARYEAELKVLEEYDREVESGSPTAPPQGRSVAVESKPVQPASQPRQATEQK